MKKLTAFALSVLLLLSCIAPAGAYRFNNNGTATKKATAYRLPSVNSGDVWWVDKNDKLEVFCRDGNFYLVLYPFNNTGKHVLAYVPTSAVSASGVPDASAFYENETVWMKESANLYHNPSADKLIGASGSNETVRSTVSKGQEVTVLFEKDGFYCIRTSNDTGFVEKSKVCTHDRLTVVILSQTSIESSDDHHKTETVYNEVCSDCAAVVRKNRSESKNAPHTLVNGVCSECGFSAETSDASCIHKNTTKHMSDDHASRYEEKNNSFHTTTSYYHVYCTDCYSYIERNLSESFEEEHLYINGTCSLCGHSAETTRPAWVTNTNGASLEIHRTAALGKTIRGEIPEGAQISVLSNQNNGFYRIEYDGIVGYVQTKYITFEQPKTNKPAYVANTDKKLLNIRSQPSLASSVVIQVAEGSTVTVTGAETNGFYPVSVDGCDGYAMANYITFTNTTPASGKDAWVSGTNGTALTIHRLPAFGKTTRGEIPAGAQLTVFGDKTNGFYRVEYNHISGYAEAKYIVFSKPTASKNAWVYNTGGESLPIHRTSAIGKTIRGNIPAKAQIVVTGEKTNEFYPVEYKGTSGYVEAAYVTFTKPASGTTAWAYSKNGDNVKIHRTSALGKTIRGQIPYGAEITITGAKTNNFYPIDYNGITGYVEAASVTTKKPDNNVFLWPVKGSKSITCRWLGYTNHHGLDIGGNPPGTSMEIVASKAGTVSYIANKCPHDVPKEKSCGCDYGYGRRVVIDHHDGTETHYAHLRSISVKKGDKVSQGQKIGMMGTTGNSTGVHLHFEIRINGVCKNPENYVKP